MDKKRILVTGIGGNVGQGILRNILSLELPVELFGCNVVEFSPGNYFCKEVFKVPFAYDKEYIPAIKDIVVSQKIDLVIPSTDYEVYYLAKHRDEIPCTVATSGPIASGLYLDKYKTFLHHKKYDIPFADSVLPGQYKGQFGDIILKPREGRGSRGIFINPTNLDGFSDDKYMVQPLLKGKEITTAFYVDKQRKLHGMITMERSLENGTTTACNVIMEYDAQLLPILNRIILASDVEGAVNLQSIVTEDRAIVPFEVNCRISGTNSIRSNFGFKDVWYTLQENLYHTAPDKVEVTKGKAVRVLMDIIYKEDQSDQQPYIF
ncbi:MAG: ATP-grasp protein [Bacteroidetes bacterium]|jgi:carbamoyl-phosphate synthase large subunit|nr:ATP-grasp protein [Bacteroidota bacterium]